MASITRSIRTRGGLAATFELYADGATRHTVAAAVAQGSIHRVRQGWFVLPGTDPTLVAAARVGGVATCLSGLAARGVWTMPTETLHVAVPANACRLRQPTDQFERLAPGPPVRTHWRVHPGTIGRLLASTLECIADLICCADPFTVIASVDSALNRRLITESEWARCLDSAPRDRRRRIPNADARCESGIESIVRCRLAELGIRSTPQVVVEGVGRVDLLVGEALVIEVDGREFHAGADRFEADRRRDALLSSRGFRVARFSYAQVVSRWDEVEAAVVAAIVRGDHWS